MASLKEVKIRINSVSSTRKITSAMKLVASSKLHKAQAAIESMRPYQQRLDNIMSRFVSELEGESSSPYAAKRQVAKAVVVCVSSNSSLCGAFNSNVIKATTQVIDTLHNSGAEVEVLPVGVKIADKMKRLDFEFKSNNSSLLDHTKYADVAVLADDLMRRFEQKEIDKVVIVYNHFKNTASQIVTTETFLPVQLDTKSGVVENKDGMALDYIIEPTKAEIVDTLIPKVLSLKLYTAVLDSLAAEHSARVVAMQTATDNADELLHELTLMYNKTRQAAITAELLDIVGASFQ